MPRVGGTIISSAISPMIDAIPKNKNFSGRLPNEKDGSLRFLKKDRLIRQV